MAGSRARGGPRVLQVVLSLHPGGTERLVVELVRRLDPEIPMAVCCLDEPGPWAHTVEAAGVAVTSLGRRPGFHPTLALGVARAVAAHRATVVHAHHYSPFVYSAFARLRHLACRLLYTEHGRVTDAPPSRKRRIANTVLRHAAHGVFAVSEDLKAHLVGEGFRASAVRVLANGIDVGPPVTAEERTRLRGQLAVAPEALVIGTIARLDPVKDLGTLLQGIARLVGQFPMLVPIIGDGPERAALERQSAALGLTSHVRFLGHRDDARRWLAACDLYVNCSRSEGVSLTILEAMAAGLPVVATRVGGTPDVVDEHCGILVPAGDAEALAAAIRTFGLDSTRRAQAGVASRHRVSGSFRLEHMIDQYRAVYRDAS